MKSIPSWTAEQLEADRQKAIAEFRRVRVQEPLERYLDFFDEYRELVEGLLEETVDLSRLRDHLADLIGDKRTREVVRFLAGPPISLDDLKVLADTTSVSKKRLKADPELVKRVVAVIWTGLDRGRFPWVIDNREPTEAERTAAAVASAALMAYSKLQAKRRSEGKTQQEDAVVAALREAAFEEIRPMPIHVLEDGPKQGQFCRETVLGTRKADIVVRLWDRRVMPIECKVSNSFVNSIKRLNNDAAAKGEAWLKDFGARQVVPCAVIGGTYHLSKLLEAQERGLALFWAHDLAAMLAWIDGTKAE
jgi:hypothetical protein